MPSLRDTQQAFLQSLFAHDGTGHFLEAIVDGGHEATRRLAVYRGTVHNNLREALRAVYPVVEKLVGREFFDFAADRHIASTPSRSGDIHDYGGEFPQFLADFTPAAGLPYLADIARLEWHLHEIFHAAEATPLDIGQLTSVPPQRYGELRFTVHPACRFMTSQFPVHAIWQANQDDTDAVPEIHLDGGGVALLIRRRAYVMELLPLAAGEYVLLERLMQGKRLAEALDEAFAAETDFDASAVLYRHAQQGTLTGFV